MPDHLDPRIANNFIDANVRDDTGGPEAVAANTILQLHQREDNDFTLLYTNSVRAEIGHPHTPADVKRRAACMIYSETVELIGAEKQKQELVRALIQGNSKPGQHDRDVLHLVQSARYGRHFITNDVRLLKKAPEIWRILQLKVLRPSEWLAAYKAHSANRTAT
jgi:hypothetical protein